VAGAWPPALVAGGRCWRSRLAGHPHITWVAPASEELDRRGIVSAKNRREFPIFSWWRELQTPVFCTVWDPAASPTVAHVAASAAVAPAVVHRSPSYHTSCRHKGPSKQGPTLPVTNQRYRLGRGRVRVAESRDLSAVFAERGQSRIKKSPCPLPPAGRCLAVFSATHAHHIPDPTTEPHGAGDGAQAGSARDGRAGRGARRRARGRRGARQGPRARGRQGRGAVPGGGRREALELRG
jgi:hypothetical protein